MNIIRIHYLLLKKVMYFYDINLLYVFNTVAKGDQGVTLLSSLCK